MKRGLDLAPDRFRPSMVPVPSVEQGHERAWKAVYTWYAMTRRLWQARNFSPLAISANLGYRFYAHNLQRFYTCDLPIAPVLPNPVAGWRILEVVAGKDQAMVF